MNIEFSHRPGEWFEWEWYYSPQGNEFSQVIGWLYTTFGHPGASGEWNGTGGYIRFRNKKDAEWFKLRWS